VGALAQADAIRSKPLGFNGAVELDHADDHLRLLEATHLGQDIELVVTCRVASKGFTHSTRIKGDGEEDVVGYQVKLKVNGVQAIR
jgi:hypothetical protein